MTEEQIEILIAKMLDAPSSLSDEELDSILQDEDLRSFYAASAALGNACIRQPEWDMEAECARFRPRLRRKPSMARWITWAAAIFLGVIFMSSIVVRIVDNEFSTKQQSVIANVKQSHEKDIAPEDIQSPQFAEKKEDADQEPTINNSTSTVSNSHLAKAEINHSKAKDTKEDSDIDVDEYLRIQQARIDNDLGLQMAETYIENYDNVSAILDATGTYNPELDNMIRKVTME